MGGVRGDLTWVPGVEGVDGRDLDGLDGLKRKDGQGRIRINRTGADIQSLARSMARRGDLLQLY